MCLALGVGVQATIPDRGAGGGDGGVPVLLGR